MDINAEMYVFDKYKYKYKQRSLTIHAILQKESILLCFHCNILGINYPEKTFYLYFGCCFYYTKLPSNYII